MTLETPVTDPTPAPTYPRWEPNGPGHFGLLRSLYGPVLAEIAYLDGTWHWYVFPRSDDATFDKGSEPDAYDAARAAMGALVAAGVLSEDTVVYGIPMGERRAACEALARHARSMDGFAHIATVGGCPVPGEDAFHVVCVLRVNNGDSYATALRAAADAFESVHGDMGVEP